MTHKLKILSRYYEAILQGKKTFEVRKDDRPFKEGDTLLLEERITPDGYGYTGREMTVEVTYILRDSEYVKDGYCIMGIKIISTNKARYYNNTPSRRAKRAADVQPISQWISVKDRLPNDGERVIVYTVEGSVLEMKFDKRRESWGRLDIDGMEWFGKSFVTHWQPLPEPPNKNIKFMRRNTDETT